jgi:hypothetical protein
MASLRFKPLVRLISGLFGLALVFVVLMVELLASKSGWTPGFMLALLLTGAPCGLLLYFARTGRWALASVLVAPLLVLVQSITVLFFLGLFPLSPVIYITASVFASWLVVVLIHGIRLNHETRRTAT